MIGRVAIKELRLNSGKVKLNNSKEFLHWKTNLIKQITKTKDSTMHSNHGQDKYRTGKINTQS